jgi:hypothetical protein
VNFGGWLSLDDAPAQAPDAPGLMQARGEKLLAYPRGKSAMVLYACCRSDETLRHYVRGRGAQALGRASASGARYVRFGAAQAPDLELHRLLRHFVDRFGAVPVANLEAEAETSPDHE